MTEYYPGHPSDLVITSDIGGYFFTNAFTPPRHPQSTGYNPRDNTYRCSLSTLTCSLFMRDATPTMIFDRIIVTPPAAQLGRVFVP
jgi:hypothetical protein